MSDNNLQEKETTVQPRLFKPESGNKKRKYICHLNIKATKEFVTELQALVSEGIKTENIQSLDKKIEFTTNINGCCIGIIDDNESIIITEIKK